MRTSLGFWLRAGLAVCALGAILVAGAQRAAVAAEWRALVIGVDAYEQVAPLSGAVNDARDIADTLKAAGVIDVTTLFDGAARRQAILSEWQSLVDRSATDDILVLSYAGHGAQEEEWRKGSERDGLDEVFLLAGFGLEAPANGERLRDDDLTAMLLAAGGRQVLFLADSCHSGTMTRSIDPRIGRLGTRLVGLPPLQNDVLRSAAPVATGRQTDAPEPEALRNVIYIGATLDGRVIPELMIGGEPRGALSWAFARGVEGRADLDRDGGISMTELTRFLAETVRVATEGRQEPSLTLGPASRSAVLPRVRTDFLDIEAGQLTVSASTEEALPVLALLAKQHPGRVSIVSDASADLFWDLERGDVLTRLGDVIAEGEATSATTLAGVVTKWLFLSDLYELARSRLPIEGELRPAVGYIPEGDPLQVGLTSAEAGFMAVFALEADGTLRLLAPDSRADPLGRDAKVASGMPYVLDLKAVRPFGADHIVLVQSREPLSKLVGVLSALDGTVLSAELTTSLLGLLKESAQGIGVVGVYTQPAGRRN